MHSDVRRIFRVLLIRNNKPNLITGSRWPITEIILTRLHME